MRYPAPGEPQFVIILQGFNALAEHFEYLPEFIDQGIRHVLAAAAANHVYLAKELEKPHILTGATQASIQVINQSGMPVSDPLTAVWREGDAYVIETGAGGDTQYGPADPQTRLLELGFRHWRSGNFIQYPFMVPASDMLDDTVVANCEAVLYAGEQFLFSSQIYAPVGSLLSRAREFLYNTSKYLGDIQIIAGSPFLGKVRTYALKGARSVGDFTAVMRGAVLTRAYTRVAGQSIGQTMGVLRGGFAAPAARFSTAIPGSYTTVAQRVYSRVAGRGFGMSLRSLSLDG